MKKYLFLIYILIFLCLSNVSGNSLSNEFLIAKPNMLDPRFQKTVIFMLYHNEEGAAGLVVNKPIKKMSILQLFESSNQNPPININEIIITLYWGGPVEPNNIFFIHSLDYESDNLIFSNEDFIITRDPKVLFDIAQNKGPKNYLILKGISSWVPDQLDYEIKGDSWVKKTGNYIPIFDNGNEMWKRLIDSQAI